MRLLPSPRVESPCTRRLKRLMPVGCIYWTAKCVLIQPVDV